MVDWGRSYGATTPSHLGLKAAGPLCTAFVVPSIISRGAPCQATWETSVSEGRIYGREMADKFCHHLASSTPSEGFFNIPQICDMRPMALLPLRRKACWGFFCPEKSDGFDWVWTRVPEASMLTTRPVQKHSLSSLHLWFLCAILIWCCHSKPLIFATFSEDLFATWCCNPVLCSFNDRIQVSRHLLLHQFPYYRLITLLHIVW
jgi:hypothetical protein